MAKGAYIGVSGKARKIKKGYIGVDGAARKIKKAYLGIGGVARPCWSGGELVYYGTIPALSQARNELSAVSNEKYALFGGGRINMSPYSTLDYYDEALVKGVGSLSFAAICPACSKVGSYVLFAGGGTGDYVAGGGVSTVNAFDPSMTRSAPTALSQAREGVAGTFVSEYAIFAGGYYEKINVSAGMYDTVDIYDTNLTRTLKHLPTKQADVTGCRTLNHGVVVRLAAYAFDDELTITALDSLSLDRQSATCTELDGSAVICGGRSRTAVVERYDVDLTRSTLTSLSQAVARPAATSVDGFAVIAGGGDGYGTSINCVKTVEVFDETFVKTVFPHTLSTIRQLLAAATIGTYGIFAGGSTATYTAGVTTAEAFTVV